MDFFCNFKYCDTKYCDTKYCCIIKIFRVQKRFILVSVFETKISYPIVINIKRIKWTLGNIKYIFYGNKAIIVPKFSDPVLSVFQFASNILGLSSHLPNGIRYLQRSIYAGAVKQPLLTSTLARHKAGQKTFGANPNTKNVDRKNWNSDVKRLSF